jgi:hypothetical protein
VALVLQRLLLLKVGLQKNVPGQSAVLEAKEVWKVKAPNEFSFFMWLAIQDRCWTAERRHRHGLQSSSSCAFCNQLPESVDHLLVACVISCEIWFKCLRRYGWQLLAWTADDELTPWWLRRRKQVAKVVRRKAFDSLCVLIARNI